MVMSFDIGDRRIGGKRPCYIVAEVGLNHGGDLARALFYIDEIAGAGADAVKFQCHIAAAESTPDEPWRVDPGTGETRYEYWQRHEFTAAQWAQLRDAAADRGIDFLCSVFSIEAAEMMNPLVPAWKIASGEVTHEPLLDYLAGTGKPALISTGMANWHEIEACAKRFKDYALLQCTSKYPCPPKDVGLDEILLMQRITNRPIGLSDHSGTVWPSVAAATLGASVVEVHVKLVHSMQGLDSSSSVTIKDLALMCDGIRFIESCRAPVDKDKMAEELKPMRDLFLDKWRRRQEVA